MARSSYERAYKYPNANYILRIITLVISLVGTALTVYTTSQEFKVDDNGGLMSYAYLAALGYAFIWSLAYMITTWDKKGRAPMHPGVQVGLDLLAIVVLCFLGVMRYYPWPEYWPLETGAACYGRKPKEYCDIYNKIYRTNIVAIVLTYIDAVIFIILFVFACMACHKARQLKKSDRASSYVLELEHCGSKGSDNV